MTANIHKIFMLVLLALTAGCDPLDMRLHIVNNSEEVVYFDFAFDDRLDTSMIKNISPFHGSKVDDDTKYVHRILPSDTSILAYFVSWETQINRRSEDRRIRVYLFLEDVLATKTHSTIVLENLHLKKYVLSVQELEKINWTIVYPSE